MARFQSLAQWLSWQSTLHSKAIDLGLDRVRQVWQQLDCGKPAARVIVVAGTNGKGSIVNLLETAYHQAGYRCGAYTSPHLFHYNERIHLQGQAVTDQLICEAFAAVDEARGETSLSYFEFGTLAALWIFAQQQLDVAILEVGLGGRLDAVNIIDADVAVISSISLDHTDWLGDTREAINHEKLGIARPGRPLVYAETRLSQTMQEQLQQCQAQVYQLGQHFNYERKEQQWDWYSQPLCHYSLPLPGLRGRHQLANAAAVIQVLSLLQQDLPLSQQQLRDALNSQNLLGRFTILNNDPLVVVDVAHNEDACAVLSENLRQLYPPGGYQAIFSVLQSKQLVPMLKALQGQIDYWHLVPLNTELARAPQELAKALQAQGVGPQQISVAANMANAVQQANERNQPLLVFGSFYLVQDFMEQYREQVKYRQ